MELNNILSDLEKIKAEYSTNSGDKKLGQIFDKTYKAVNLCKLHYEVMDNVNKILSTCLETDEIYRQICDELHKLVDWDRVSIAIFEETAGIVTAIVLSKGFNTKVFPEKRNYSYKGSILEKIITAGEPVIIDDTGKGILSTDKIHHREGTKSRLAYPLKFKGKIVGSINFSSRNVSNFSKENFGILTHVAPILAFLVDNALEKEIIRNINDVLASSFEPEDLYHRVCDELYKLINWDRVSIALYEEASGIITAFVLTKGFKTKIFPEKRNYQFKGSILEKVITTGEAVIIDDTSKNVLETDKSYFDEGIRSRLAYPLKFKGTIIGSVNFSSHNVKSFNSTMFPILGHIAPLLSFMVENTKLFAEASKHEKEYKDLTKTIDTPWV